MTFCVLLITNRCHIAVHDTRVRALLLITKIWDPNWATHAGPFWTDWAEIWTIFGNPHGIHMKQVDKNRMGPYGLLIWALYSCPYGSHVGPRFCASWVHLKIVVVKWGFVIIAKQSYEGGGFHCSSALCLLFLSF